MPVLTVPAVKKYAAQAHRREIPDSRAPGLYLVIQPKPTAAKSWALRFRRPDGRPAKMTLGRVDLGDVETTDEPVLGGALTLRQARELANRIDRQRATGIDVIEERAAARRRDRTAAIDRAVTSFGRCVREFFVDYRTKKRNAPQRRWRDNAAHLGLRYPPGSNPATTEPVLIKGGLADIWADKPVASIDSHDIHTVVSESKKRGNDGRARKLHAALSVLFSWLLSERRVTANPCVGVARPGPPPARERVLTDPEVVAFWRACEKIGAPFGPLFQTMLLTGCRLREAAGMTRTELVDGVWTIPGARTKNHRPLTLALPPLALSIIASVPAIESAAGYVFTITGNTPLNGFSHAKELLDAGMEEFGFSEAKALLDAANKIGAGWWRLHDLRRTFASGLAGLNVSLPVIERLLNHVSGSFAGIVGVYQKHKFSKEKAEALARWAAHIEGLVADRSNVVPMKKERK
jgi:integrase